MIDVRDSAFQRDPFMILSSSGEDEFHVFKEDQLFPIKDCGWNGGWVKDCFGEKVCTILLVNYVYYLYHLYIDAE